MRKIRRIIKSASLLMTLAGLIRTAYNFWAVRPGVIEKRWTKWADAQLRDFCRMGDLSPSKTAEFETAEKKILLWCQARQARVHVCPPVQEVAYAASLYLMRGSFDDMDVLVVEDAILSLPLTERSRRWLLARVDQQLRLARPVRRLQEVAR
jgi:hypothetical protein